MPLHDWTRVPAWARHNFELSWRCKLCDRLNNGGIPKSHFAFKETLDLRPQTGFSEMNEPERRASEKCAPLPDTEPPTGFQHLAASRPAVYATGVTTIRHSDYFAVEAAIYLVSKQDAQIPYRKRGIVESAVGALTRGIHVLVVDLQGDSRTPSDTISESIWRELGNPPWERSAEVALTLASFHADAPMNVYLETTKAGLALAEMPLFLARDSFVPLPLEATYMATWETMPEPIRELVEIVP